MTIDFTQPVFYDQPNQGYMVTVKELPAATSGVPNYEVCEADPFCPVDLKQQLNTWLSANPNPPAYVPPAAVPPTPAQQAQATIAAIQAKLINAQVVGPNAVSLGLTAADIANWKAAQVVLAGVNS